MKLLEAFPLGCPQFGIAAVHISDLIVQYWAILAQLLVHRELIVEERAKNLVALFGKMIDAHKLIFLRNLLSVQLVLKLLGQSFSRLVKLHDKRNSSSDVLILVCEVPQVRTKSQIQVDFTHKLTNNLSGALQQL